jgi:hypothetical protein
MAAVQRAAADRPRGLLTPRREHVEVPLHQAAPAPEHEQGTPDAAVQVRLVVG